MIFLLITLWIISGLLLAGFMFGPFYNNEHEVDRLRIHSVLSGIFMGPFVLLMVLSFYTEFWDTLGRLQYKFVLTK